MQKGMQKTGLQVPENSEQLQQKNNEIITRIEEMGKKQNGRMKRM